MHAIRATFIALAGLLGAAALLPVTAGAAEATCGGLHYNHLFATWFDEQPDHAVGGLRAGVQVRLDSDICSPGDGNGTALWIGLQGDQLTPNLVQAGFDYYRDTSGQMHRCRFWEVTPDLPHNYGACNPVDGRYNYWSIHKYYNGSTNKVAIEDCDGDSNFTTCNVIASGIDPNHINNDFAELAGETQHPNCRDTMTGDASNPANIGNSTNPVEVEHDNGDPWIHSENFDLQAQDGDYKCPNFHKSLPHPNAFTVWDDRNVN